MITQAKNPQISIGNTQAQKQLSSFLRKRDPNLTERELGILMVAIKRFVTVVQKIYTEPQAQIKYKEVEENGIKIKKKVIETDIWELGKVNKGKSVPLERAIRDFNEKVTGKSKKIHGK